MIEDKIEKDRRMLYASIYLVLFVAIGFGLAYVDDISITGFAIGGYFPPSLLSIPGQNISNEETFAEINLNPLVNDPDTPDQDLIWTFEENDNIEVTIEDGIVTLTPVEGWIGTDTIRFIVTDPQNLTTSKEAYFTVYFLNHPPTIQPIEDIVANESELIKIEPNATDPDGDELTFEYSEYFNPEGEWTPPLDLTNDEQIITVQVTVHDTRGGEASTEFFVTVNDINYDEIPPEILEFNIEDISKDSANITIITDELTTCGVMLGEEENNLTETYQSNTTAKNHTIEVYGLGQGRKYYYRIHCMDSSNNTQYTNILEFETIKAMMPKYSKFGGFTTNFEGKDDISCVRDAILEIPSRGLIEFEDNECIDFEGLDLDKYVTISHNNISVDTEKLTGLKNHRSKVRLYDIDMDDPGILKDGIKCSVLYCNVKSYENEILTFEVNSLSTYEAIEKREIIANDSTNGKVRSNENITFEAQYYFYGSAMKNLDCTVEYEINGTVAVIRMDYVDGVYRKTHIFNKTGKLEYTIKCEGDYHEALEHEDDIDLMPQYYCGDDVCRDDENCSTCEDDCGECCIPGWNCTDYQKCNDGIQIRVCTPNSNCTNMSTKPQEHKICTEEDPCRNGKLDSGEEDIDCGGICGSCASCDDGIKNQGEEDIDCGGPCKTCQITVKDTVSEKNTNKKENNKQTIKKNEDQPIESAKIFDPMIGLYIGLMIIALLGGFGYLKKDLILQMVEQKKPDPSIVAYAQQYLATGMNISQVKDYLKKNGWDPKVVKLSVKKADENIKELMIHQMMDIVGRYDLSNPKSVEMILSNTNFPKDMTKEAIKRLIEKRHPHLKKSMASFMSRF